MFETGTVKCGGQGRNRTADASLFRAALYQLSYLAGESSVYQTASLLVTKLPRVFYRGDRFLPQLPLRRSDTSQNAPPSCREDEEKSS